ncbi:uncharacterized protein LOC115985112 [Quercus lobata]|uniref:uncharacterized protein LOC115985112 n=1 Tax=Quercus lobata TaxID=97700 RepID=UPI001248F90C|nr:uncharacterized protein LOC115985112 [Quercus lobata]
MGLKRKPPTSLLDLLEGQSGKGAQGTPQSSASSPPPQPQAIQTRSSSTRSQPHSPRTKLPAPPRSALPPRPEPTDSKRKRSPKGKEPMDGGKSQSSQERDEAPRVKQLKIGHQSKGKESEAQSAQSKGKGIEVQSLPSAWLLAPMLHVGPLLETASMRDLGDGEGGYVADALGRAMLLPTDALQATYRMEEEVNKQSKAAENECFKRIDAARTLKASKDDLAKAKEDLKVAIQERDSASTGLDSAQRQVEEQKKRLLETEDQLQIAKGHINDLKRKLTMAEHDKGVAEHARDEAVRAKQEVEFARDEGETAKNMAEDAGYEAGMADTQASLKAQIPEVCRLYCSQVWEEAIKRAGVDASSELWKAESIFYPPAIRKTAPSSSKAVRDPEEASAAQSEAAQIIVPSGESTDGGEPLDATKALGGLNSKTPKEGAEPTVSAQIPGAEEPAILARPL